MKPWIMLVVMVAITTIVSESVKLLFAKGVIAKAVSKIKSIPPQKRRMMAHFLHFIAETVVFECMVGFLIWLWLENPVVRNFHDLFWGIFYLWMMWRGFENALKAFADWYFARREWLTLKRNQPELLLDK
jgi:hypothetical protein